MSTATMVCAAFARDSALVQRIAPLVCSISPRQLQSNAEDNAPQYRMDPNMTILMTAAEQRDWSS